MNNLHDAFGRNHNATNVVRGLYAFVDFSQFGLAEGHRPLWLRNLMGKSDKLLCGVPLKHMIVRNLVNCAPRFLRGILNSKC